MKRDVIKTDASVVLPSLLRVAAYARVSSGKDAMLHSLSAQVSYYNRIIQENENWILAGIYSDEAFTGTKDTREGFQNMIKDALEGKIDLIITKSISRFARNTLTLLETTRELKKAHINVYFEEERIYSMSNEGEMILSMLASVAQEQSRSTSENMKWRIKKDMEAGILWGGGDFLGYKLVNRHYVIVPEEAELVQRIFHLYLEGNGTGKIAKILNSEGIKSHTGIEWCRSSILLIIKNINYTGDLLLQKTFRENHLTKKTKVNKGELDKYHIENDHEPIITKAVFNEVQRILNSRGKKIIVKNNKNLNKFTGLLFCGYCGTKYKKKENKSRIYWACNKFVEQGKSKCSSRQIRQDVLIEITNQVLNMDNFDEKLLRESIDKMLIYSNENKLIYQFKDGRTIEKEYPERSRRASWTPEMKEQARIRALKQHEKEVKE